MTGQGATGLLDKLFCIVEILHVNGGADNDCSTRIVECNAISIRFVFVDNVLHVITKRPCDGMGALARFGHCEGDGDAHVLFPCSFV